MRIITISLSKQKLMTTTKKNKKKDDQRGDRRPLPAYLRENKDNSLTDGRGNAKIYYIKEKIHRDFTLKCRVSIQNKNFFPKL